MFRQLLLKNRWSRLSRANSSYTVCVKWSRNIASVNLLKSPQETASDPRSDSTFNEDVVSKERTFKDLFEASKFVDMGNPVGKVVDGKIIATVGDKLYIDFGGKFHGVVEKPTEKADRYIKGARVNVLIKDLEIGMHFLGSNKDTSLLEASIDLVGLA